MEKSLQLSQRLEEPLQIILKFIKDQARRTVVKCHVQLITYHKSSQAPNKQDKSWTEHKKESCYPGVHLTWEKYSLKKEETVSWLHLH